MIRIFIHLLLGIGAQIGPADDPGEVVIVLDASHRMEGPGVAGSTIYDTVGNALVETLTASRESRPDLRVGLRLAGWDECDGALTAIEPSEVAIDRWRTALEDRPPGGTCPLIPSVAAALTDLGDSPGPARLVVVTAGADDCGGTPVQVAEAMAGLDVAVDLRIVGLLLSDEASAFFATVPLRNVTQPDQLSEALHWALFEPTPAQSADSEPTEPQPPTAALTAPSRVEVGAVLDVEWSGPDSTEDFVSIARPDDPGDAYLDWGRCEDGNPVTLTAPSAPGGYELRYVGGTDGEVLARSPIQVEAVAVELDAAPTVVAGRRFEVRWSGSAEPGDIIAVCRPDQPWIRMSDWADTIVGSPVTLAAPDRPGRYELRYLRKEGLQILARKSLEVRR
ncbi:MAG: hypothetical protein V2I67_02065 [Thermoanaerobaculales bacterium]|jgi:hypothetical protein|nr:hypothetical protein [Thermoanaerobaculales bacterium]